MPSSQAYIEYVLERLNRLYRTTYRKMFGEYMIYINQLPIILVCDDTAFIKIHESTTPILSNNQVGYPYRGAKLHYILDIDDLELTKKAVDAILPYIILKPKKSRKKLNLQ